MAHQFNTKGKCFVILDKGYLQLYTSDGILIQPNIWLRVTDSADRNPEVIGKFLCNIVGSFEEMQQEIERFKNEK